MYTIKFIYIFLIKLFLIKTFLIIIIINTISFNYVKIVDYSFFIVKTILENVIGKKKKNLVNKYYKK